MTPNLNAFLTCISECEGTTGPDGYRALFGYTPRNGRVFDNGFATHPHIFVNYTMLDGTITKSSAAGRYQIIWVTFVDLQMKLGTKNFMPDTQDLMAVRLITDTGALDLVNRGALQAAIDMTAGIWASLPASHYAEPRRTYAFARAAYTAAGGVVST